VKKVNKPAASESRETEQGKQQSNESNDCVTFCLLRCFHLIDFEGS